MNIEYLSKSTSTKIKKNIFKEQNNIFASLNPEEYKEVLQTMKSCILATDLALFFPNKAKLANIVKEAGFDWAVGEHRRLAMSLCMTGSDLNSSSKPWQTQLNTSRLVYAEFHEQVSGLELSINQFNQSIKSCIRVSFS